MNRIWNYAMAPLYLLMFCMPPSWALRLIMQLARLRSARGPEGSWPAEAVRWAIPDLKAAWRRRMYVWALEVWQLVSGPRLRSAAASRHLSVAGIEHVREAVRSGDGAIVILTHHTGMRAIAWVLREAGLPWSLVGYAGKRRRWVKQFRRIFHFLHMWVHTRLHIRAFGARTLLSSNAAGIKQAYGRLRNGELVLMAQDIAGKRYRVKLLRRHASLALGSVRMAMATGARLIPCAVVLTENNALQVCFRPPIDQAGGEGELAEAVAEALDALILSAPELWWTEFVHPVTEGNHGRGANPKVLKDAAYRFDAD